MGDAWFDFSLVQEDGVHGRDVVVTAPGPGLASGIAGEELVEALKGKPLGPVRSTRVPAQALVTNGQPEWPIVIFDLGRVALLKCESELTGSAAHHFARDTLAFLHEAGATRVILLDGLASSLGVPEAPSRVFGVSSDAALDRDLRRSSVEPLEDGVLGGVVGAFLLWGGTPPAGALVTPTSLEVPDPRAAARLVEALGALTSLDVNVNELSSRATELEREVERLSREAGLLPRPADGAGAMYT